MDDKETDELLVDKFGFSYHDKVPQGYILATLEDFHVKGVKNIGMKYLIRWSDKEYYEPREVKPELEGKWLLPFILEDRVFIKKPN